MSSLLVLYLLVASCVTIYAYGFLDFNLTLSAHPTFLQVTQVLQHLVYYDRPRSALVYSLLMMGLFALYLLILRAVSKMAKPHFPWVAFLLLMFVVTVSYPLLSYDVFNYMFHAKILWFYHQNPHLHAPLEYSGDLWLRFMRWVHTPSAYGPVFTLVESPAYLLGLGKFVPVLYLMKATMAGFFASCVYLIGRLGHKLGWSTSRLVVAQTLIAWNPFLLLEFGYNGHNDAVMLAFFLLACLSFVSARRSLGSLAWLLALGVKFMTGLTALTLLVKSSKSRLFLSTLLLYLPVLVSPGRFQPWYLTWSLLPASLLEMQGPRTWILLASLAGLVYYIPYIATGFWVDTIAFKLGVIYVPLVLSVLWVMVYIRYRKAQNQV